MSARGIPPRSPSSTSSPLPAVGLDDGEILEVNQVTAYFAYANRTVQGLGVTTHGDVLGLLPADTGGDEWHHG